MKVHCYEYVGTLLCGYIVMRVYCYEGTLLRVCGYIVMQVHCYARMQVHCYAGILCRDYLYENWPSLG